MAVKIGGVSTRLREWPRLLVTVVVAVILAVLAAIIGNPLILAVVLTYLLAVLAFFLLRGLFSIVASWFS